MSKEKCPDCGRTFRSYVLLREHMKETGCKSQLDQWADIIMQDRSKEEDAERS